MKWLLLFSLAVNFAGIGTAAYITYFVGPRPFVLHFAEKRIMLADPKLGLSPDQEKEFARLQGEFLDKIESDFPEFHQKRVDMINALASEDFAESNVQTTADAVRQIQNRFHTEWIQYMVNLRSVLTPEQEKIFGSILRERLEFPLRSPEGSEPEIGSYK